MYYIKNTVYDEYDYIYVSEIGECITYYIPNIIVIVACDDSSKIRVKVPWCIRILM